MHIVKVDSAASKEPSANGSSWPSNPARETGTVAAASRSRPSPQPTSDGSTASTRVTAGG